MLLFDTYLLWKKISHSIRRSIVGKRELHVRNYSYAVDALPKKLPKTIWIYWDKPIDEAPLFVQYAIKSWIAKNPDWRIEVLNDQILPYLVRFEEPIGERKVQGRSDAIRLALLQKYGGVWVDATCACVRPLNEWLPPLMQTGFFAFPETYPGRIIQSWFLAAAPDNYLVDRWANAALLYYGRDGKVGHYFWVMHLFEYLIRKDRRAAAIWEATPKISAKGPSLLKRILTQKDLAEAVPIEVDLGAIPLLKISSTTETDEPELQQAMLEKRDVDLQKMVDALMKRSEA